MLNRILLCKTKVIKVYLNGGLGNQLFQFAAATSLAIESKSQLIFVDSNKKHLCPHSEYICNFVKKSLFNQGCISQRSNVLQIRMGGMARDESVRKVHGIISANYLSKALYGLSIDSKEWVVISDDFDSIQEELSGFAHLNIRNVVSKSDLEDLFVLSQAKNFIISNSTFGWWGAWLSEGQVVAPMNWFTAEGFAMRPVVDLFPSDWTLM